MPETNAAAASTLFGSDLAATVRDLALGFIAGFVIGFVLKKAIKVGIFLLLAFVAWQLFTYGKIAPEHIETAKSVQEGATNLIEQHSGDIAEVKKLFQLNMELGIGFFAGLAIGLWKG
jgi:uncharacterized membrane protein (Fun14 family)